MALAAAGKASSQVEFAPQRSKGRSRPPLARILAVSVSAPASVICWRPEDVEEAARLGFSAVEVRAVADERKTPAGRRLLAGPAQLHAERCDAPRVLVRHRLVEERLAEGEHPAPGLPHALKRHRIDLAQPDCQRALRLRPVALHVREVHALQVEHQALPGEQSAVLRVPGRAENVAAQSPTSTRQACSARRQNRSVRS